MNIIVTGAGKGIGFETVNILSENPKHQILAISRDLAEIEQLMKPNIHPLSYDLSNIESYSLLPKMISGFLKNGVDVLINNAGLLINKPFARTTLDDFEKIMNINLKSPYFLIQTLMPYFNNNAHIVNISSMGGYPGSVKFPGLSAYSISKGALCTLTETLSVELTEKNVHLNALCLGSVDTQMLKQAFPDYQANTSPHEMATYLANFALTGHHFYNGKVLPVSVSTP